MKRFARVAACIALAAMAPMALQAQGASERGPQARRASAPEASMARVIVRFSPGSALSKAQAASVRGELRHAAPLSRALGMTLADGRSIDERTQVVVASGVDPQVLAARVAATPGVEWAVVDRKRRPMATLPPPNDPLFATAPSPAVGQWYLRAPDATAVSAIDAVGAWDVTTGSSSVVVASLDTGVRLDHPDLAGKLLPGYDFVSGDGDGSFTTANDGDGFDDDPSDPGDWTVLENSSWHGTQTAGLIGAATNNGIGMASVGRDVMVLPVRVMGVDGGFDSDIQAGMRWAAGLSVPGVPANPNKAKVINLSLGGPGSCALNTGYPAVISAVRAAGVMIVASAGNDGLAVSEPANCNGVIAVAGLRHAGTKVGYSSLGPQVAIAAPAGNCVNTIGPCLYPLLTTSNSGTTAPASHIYTDGGSNPSLGTSFAAPLVSGTLGLMFSANPSLTPEQALAALKSTSRPFPTTGAGPGVGACHAPTGTPQDSECYCTTTTCGTGMLDARAAVAAAASAASAPPAPTAIIVPPATSVAAGDIVTLDGTGSTPGTGDGIAGYAWTITGGASFASFSGATDGPTATLIANAPGIVTVMLTVTGTNGQTDTATQDLTIVDAAPKPAAGGDAGGEGGGGGGGGGAASMAWLLALLSAIALLQAADRRPH